VVIEGLGRTRFPDFSERSVENSQPLEQSDVGLLARAWLHVTDELFEFNPTVSDPEQVAAGHPDRSRDADLRSLETLP
jgi:hypothetical protein